MAQNLEDMKTCESCEHKCTDENTDAGCRCNGNYCECDGCITNQPQLLNETCQLCGNTSSYDTESIKGDTYQVNGISQVICTCCIDSLLAELHKRHDERIIKEWNACNECGSPEPEEPNMCTFCKEENTCTFCEEKKEGELK